MGIYDRDYQRGGNYGYQPGFQLSAPRTMTTTLIIVTCALFVVQKLAGFQYESTFELHPDWFRRPWTVYQLLTYGFLHAPDDLWHIVLNMFGLWIFGRDVEYRYGQREFLSFYLLAIVMAGLIWSIAETLSGGLTPMLGASGGVTAVAILYAFNFPYRTVLFMFFLPMQMWMFATLFVAIDLLGAIRRSDDSKVAFTAHLGGALFAVMYFQWGWRIEQWLPRIDWLKRMRPGPKLRVHDPDTEEENNNRVDEILKKIQEHGRDSLTRSERQFLEEASRQYQKKRK